MRRTIGINHIPRIQSMLHRPTLHQTDQSTYCRAGYPTEPAHRAFSCLLSPNHDGSGIAIPITLLGNIELAQCKAALVSAFTAGPFSTTQVRFDAIKSTLKPEESDTYEIGALFKSDGFDGSIGAYLVNFRNRLLGVTTGPGIVGSPVVLQNVGGIRSAGIELAGNYRFGGGFGLFASYSYNDATYRNDVGDGTGALVAAIKGKTITDVPQHLLKVDASHNSDSFFGRIGVNHMSKRYITYTNSLGELPQPRRTALVLSMAGHWSMRPSAIASAWAFCARPKSS